ncbi:MAG: hypothetical protein VKI39_06410 [Synechococcus sp.]|nr:hypothetical protein [Synechococcus sp.]
MLIYTCVSAHGFGHGSRTAAVLTALHQRNPGWRLALSTTLPEAFLRQALGPVPFDYRPCRWDVGVLQADALGVNPAATLQALVALESSLPALLAQEQAWLAEQNCSVLVLADVPPAAAELARRVDSPLVWLANFGWDAIYGAMGAEFIPWARQCHYAYRQGDLLLHCPLAMSMDWGLPEVRLGLTAGTPRLDARAVASQLNLPGERDRCVLVSFGGLGLSLGSELFKLWPEHTFICADPMLADAANVKLLPAGMRPLEVLPLCGRLVTKPGYSSFCEALSMGVGIHLVHREGFAEAPVLEAALVRHGWHRLLGKAQALVGDWELDQPLKPPTDPPLPIDGCVDAAKAIESFAANRVRHVDLNQAE